MQTNAEEMKAKIMEQKIQTLHPQPGKTNKKIALSKYNFIKENILSILSNNNWTI